PADMGYFSFSQPATNTFIGLNSEWRYLDDGSDQGTSWTAIGFGDAGWSNGVAQLGYGETDETTLIRSNRLDGTRIVTTYFRRAFQVSHASSYTNLALQLLRDDGGAVY